MLRCAPSSAETRHLARSAPARIAAAAGRVASPLCVPTNVVAAPPLRRSSIRRGISVAGAGGSIRSIRARAALGVQEASPPLALLDGVTRHCLEVDYGGRKIKIETGEIARQANGAVTLTDGETILLATACAEAPPSGSSSNSSQQHGDGSFVPLQVNYSERFSAAGRTTGSFFKRDGRPKDSETLVSRLVDRPLRPNFAKGWSSETQVLVWVVSYDGAHSPEPLAITAAGAALAVSDIPLAKAVVGARVALLPSDYDFSREDAADGDDGNGRTSRAKSPCGGWLVANPTVRQASSSSLDLVLAGTATAVMMIEGFCTFLEDSVMVAAVELGAAAVAATAAAVDEWALAVRKEAGVEKRTDRVLPDPSVYDSVREFASPLLDEAFRSGKSKEELSASVAEIKRGAAAAVGLVDASTSTSAAISGGDGSGDRASASSSATATTASADSDDEGGGRGGGKAGLKPSEAAFNSAFKRVTSASMRSAVLDSGVRSDGRAADEVRPIAARAGLLPRTHGSALFTRGETQALAVTTLGTSSSAQRVDSMTVVAGGSGDAATSSSTDSSFYLQYFFPPCSVGETGRVGSPGRREVGHGALAERALAPVVPTQEEFPYTVRVESTITESNGSSSMASVCGGCLSMMDAGVPIKAVVAGVAMGLILEQKDESGSASNPARFQILTDILGSEDALGDMDFKVAGDEDRVTAFQMDVKVDGITPEIISAALSAARDARRTVLSAMALCSPPPREALGPHSPRIELVRVPTEKLGQIIGPGGKTIRGIRDASGCESVNVLPDSESLDGTALVELCDIAPEAVASAKAMVLAIAIDPLPGSQFPGSRVNSVERFGLIVEFVPGRSGLAHVSELPFSKSDPDSYSVGDKVDVVLLEGENGRYKLSLRAFPGSGGGDDEGERRGGSGRGGGRRDRDSGGSSWAESSPSSGSFSSSRSNFRDNDAPPPPPRAPLQPVEEGAVFRGATVRGVQPFGVFADLGGGRSGMIHVSELREPRPSDPNDRYSRGDKVDVVVLSAENGRISLSEKRVEEGGAGKAVSGDGDFDDDDYDDDDDDAPRTPRQLAEETSKRLGLEDDDEEDDFDESDFA